MLPAILAGIGAAGSIYGMVKGRPKVKRVDLARDNPELWKQLQELRSMSDEIDNQYKIRQQGANAGEISNMAQARAQAYERQGNLGLVGSSAGASQMGRQEAEMQNALGQRIMQDQERLANQAMAAKQAYLNQYSSAYGNQLGQNRMDQEAQMQEDMARNQFFGGLVNSGIGMYGQQEYLDTMRDPNFVQNMNFVNQRPEAGFSYSNPTPSPIYSQQTARPNYLPPSINPVDLPPYNTNSVEYWR